MGGFKEDTVVFISAYMVSQRCRRVSDALTGTPVAGARETRLQRAHSPSACFPRYPYRRTGAGVGDCFPVGSNLG